MKFKKILMLGYSGDDLDKDFWNKIGQLCEKRVLIAVNSPELSKHLDADALVVKFAEVVDKNLIDKMPNLGYIGTLATAFGRIDTRYAASKNIPVCNIPGYSTIAVAEFAFGVILEHIREVERGKRQAREGNYSEAGFRAYEIQGKTFGVIGLGAIGSRIAEIALGFGADVIYWSRSRKKGYEEKDIRYMGGDEVLKDSDFVSINLALTNETKNFINKERMKKIKKGAVVVNLAQMDLVDINALEERLKKGDITFIYDHSDELSKEENERLAKYKNCIVYPPIAYITREARARKQEIFFKNLKGFLEGKIQNQVN